MLRSSTRPARGTPAAISRLRGLTSSGPAGSSMATSATALPGLAPQLYLWVRLKLGQLFWSLTPLVYPKSAVWQPQFFSRRRMVRRPFNAGCLIGFSCGGHGEPLIRIRRATCQRQGGSASGAGISWISEETKRSTRGARGRATPADHFGSCSYPTRRR